MDDQRRIDQLVLHAANLRKLKFSVKPEEMSVLNEAAHDIEKFAKLVIDRDAGPSNDVRAENTKLAEQVKQLESRIAEHVEFVDLAKKAVAALSNERDALKRAFVELKKINDRLGSENEEMRNPKGSVEEELGTEPNG